MEDEDAIAEGLGEIARALRDLGNANAATPMGAIEAFGLVMKEGLDRIADMMSDDAALQDLGESLGSALSASAAAQHKQADAIVEYLAWRRKAGI